MEKFMMIVAAILACIMFLAVTLFACPKGSEPYNGVCVVDLRPADSPIGNNSNWVSDEKPPKDKMPSYEREGIHIVSAPPGVEASQTVAHDYKSEGNQQ